MTRQEADKLVRDALTLLENEQRELIELDVSERALSHHLAGYIAERVPGEFDVDVEYNRHRQYPKRLNLPPRDARDDELRATTVFPDIIVHVRGSDDWNEIVLEVKKLGESVDYDDLKLRAFQTQLGYRHCGHVVLGVDTSGSIVAELYWLAA